MTKQELQSQLSNVERAIDCIKEMIAELKAGDRAKWGYLLPHSEGVFRSYDKRCAGEYHTQSEAA